MDTFSSFPFVRIIIPFITGIIIYDYFTVQTITVYVILALSLLLSLFFYQLRKEQQLRFRIYSGFLIFLFLLSSGMVISYNQDWTQSEIAWNNFLDQKNHKQFFHVRIDNDIVTSERTGKCFASVKAVKKEDQWYSSKGNILIYFQRDSTSDIIQSGDYILIHGTAQQLSKPLNPGDFDYATYLDQKRIYYSIYATKESFVKTGHSENLIYEFSSGIRTTLENVIEKTTWNKNQKSIALALLLGTRTEMDPELMQAFSATGTMHVLSVSGLHAGLLYFALKKILDTLLKSKKLKILKIFLCLLILWLYAFITGLSPSVNRAVTMLSFVLIGELYERNSGIYNSLAASAFVLLVTDTRLLYSAGFQLSFLAVWGIVFFQNRIYSFHYFRNRWMDKTWQLTAVTISAQLATLPCGLYYFHTFPLWFLFSNLIIIPLATIVLYSGIIFLLLSCIPFLDQFRMK